MAPRIGSISAPFKLHRLSTGGYLSVETDTGTPLEVDAQVMSGGVEATFSEEESSVSIGYTAAAVAITIGDNAPSENNAHDNRIRVGVGAGGGAGVRLHNTDVDGDDIPEVGFGVDIGPVSFDVRSETLGHASNALADTLHEGPQGVRGTPGAELDARRAADPELDRELTAREEAVAIDTNSRLALYRRMMQHPRWGGDRRQVENELRRWTEVADRSGWDAVGDVLGLE